MTARQWKLMMFEFVDGLTTHLSASTPTSARDQLATVRRSAAAADSATKRRRCETRLNALVESQPCFRGAAKRYLRPKVRQALLDATTVWIKAVSMLPVDERRAAVERQMASFNDAGRGRPSRRGA